MAPINRDPAAAHIAIEICPAADLPLLGQQASPRRTSATNLHAGTVTPGLAALPRLPPRNAPFPTDHVVIDIPAQARLQNFGQGRSRQSPDGQASRNDCQPLPSNAGESSRNVTFQRKLAATLQTGIGTAAPLAALNFAADLAGSAMLGTASHAAGSFGSNIKAGLAAAGMGIAADVAVTTLVTAVGHTYLDNKLFHEKNKTADEMIATKKANSAILAYIGGTGSSVAMTMAATALTGGTVTAGGVATGFAAQAIGGLIAHPLALGTAALAYQFKRGPSRQPDSLEAGIDGYVDWIQEKLSKTPTAKISTSAASHRNEPPSVAHGDDMV